MLTLYESGLWTGQSAPSRRVVPIAALQQIIFNAVRAVLERVIRDQGLTTKSHFLSRLTPILDKYVLQWVGVRWTSLLEKYVLLWMSDTPSIGHCFHPPENRAMCDSTYR